MSEALDRLRKTMRQEQARAVQAELRKGATIEQAMAATGTVKRFVEEQRAYLKQTEGLADTRRNDTGTTIAKMEAGGKTSAEIMKVLKITRSTLHYHRRKNRKVS